MQPLEIKEAVFRGALPLKLYRVISDHAPQPKATVSHMQLRAVKCAETQLQHRVQLYILEAQRAPDSKRKYYNLLKHYQAVQPRDWPHTPLHSLQGTLSTPRVAPPYTPHYTDRRHARRGHTSHGSPSPCFSSGCPTASPPIHSSYHATFASSPSAAAMTSAAAAARQSIGSAACASPRCTPASFLDGSNPSASLPGSPRRMTSWCTWSGGWPPRILAPLRSHGQKLQPGCGVAGVAGG